MSGSFVGHSGAQGGAPSPPSQQGALKRGLNNANISFSTSDDDEGFGDDADILMPVSSSGLLLPFAVGVILLVLV